MKSNFLNANRLNVFLSLLVIGLVFVATQKPGLDNKKPEIKISQLKAEEIQRIDIIASDRDVITFFKKDQNWYVIIAGKEEVLDQDKLNPLFDLLNANSLDSFTASDDQLKQYHLVNPRLNIKFDNFQIAFGDSEPLKHRRYLLINKQVHLVADLHYHFLLQPVQSYINSKKK